MQLTRGEEEPLSGVHGVHQYGNGADAHLQHHVNDDRADESLGLCVQPMEHVRRPHDGKPMGQVIILVDRHVMEALCSGVTLDSSQTLPTQTK